MGTPPLTRADRETPNYRHSEVSTPTTFAIPDTLIQSRLLSCYTSTPFLFLILTISPSIMSASKAQSQKIFEKLKLKPANKVRAGLALVTVWRCFGHCSLMTLLL